MVIGRWTTLSGAVCYCIERIERLAEYWRTGECPTHERGRAAARHQFVSNVLPRCSSSMRTKIDKFRWARGLVSALTSASLAAASSPQSVVYVPPAAPLYYGAGGGMPVSQNIDITGSGSTDFVLYGDGVENVDLYPQGSNRSEER